MLRHGCITKELGVLYRKKSQVLIGLSGNDLRHEKWIMLKIRTEINRQ